MLWFLRYDHRQHGGEHSAGRVSDGESSGSHAEAPSPPEREEAQQPHPAGSLHRRHRQETFRPPPAGEER